MTMVYGGDSHRLCLIGKSTLPQHHRIHVRIHASMSGRYAKHHLW